jgi:hypothetical protein
MLKQKFFYAYKDDVALLNDAVLDCGTGNIDLFNLNLLQPDSSAQLVKIELKIVAVGTCHTVSKFIPNKKDPAGPAVKEVKEDVKKSEKNRCYD